MDRSGRLSLIVGAFVLVCLAAGMAVILSLTSEKGIFNVRYPLEARFRNVQGLLPGAPVWLAGKSVGVISMVSFDALGSTHPIRVTLLVDESVSERIRGDSVASIGTIGVLGDSYVEVSVGSLETEELDPGAELEAIDPTNLYAVMAHATVAMDNIAKLAADLNSGILVQAGTAMESVTSLATNLDGIVRNFADEGGGEKAASAVQAVGDILLTIKSGDGLLHRVIYDDDSGQSIDGVQRSLSELEALIAQFRDVVYQIQEGSGLAHSLIYGAPEEGERDVVMEFIEAGARLNSILGKVDEGEGTLGLLLNDPSLYEDVRTLLGGAQRSRVVRTLIKLSAEEEN